MSKFHPLTHATTKAEFEKAIERMEAALRRAGMAYDHERLRADMLMRLNSLRQAHGKKERA